MAQETCRDVVHVTLGLEAMANAAETARLQGVDLFGPEQTRIVDGTELAAELDLVVLANADASGKASVRSDVCGGTVTIGGPTYPSLGFEIAYNHYAGRLGVSMPKTAALLAKLRPTDAALHMAWETLTSVGAP